MKQYLDQTGVEYLWGRVKNNFAKLDSDGKVPASQLPSYLDDVEEYSSLSSFPTTGEAGKIYVARDTNLIYRWGGAAYVEISPSIALGETSTTAYPGDKGKKLASDLQSEVDRATAAESDIRSAITAEQNRAQNSEQELKGLIEKNADNTTKISEALETETQARIDADATEKTERQSEDNAIKASITTEVNRATAAETTLDNKIESVKIVKVDSSDNTIAASYQLQLNGEAKGATIDIAKDQSIKDIEVLDMNATLNSDGTINAGSPAGTTALCIVYILADGSYKLAKLDYSKFLEEAEFADGLTVKDHKVYVKVDSSSESFLTVSSTGVKLSGVQTAINTAVASEKAARESADTQLTNLVNSTKEAITADLNSEIERAKAAEAEITSNLDSEGIPLDTLAEILITS